MKPIRGTTEECLAHFAKAINGPNFFEKRRQFAQFANVAEQTVHCWFQDTNFPKGESLIRVRYYLEFQGYKVAELESLQKEVRDAGRVYAFGVVSLEEFSKSVDYGIGAEYNSEILRVLRGARRISGRTLEQFSAFVELYGAELEAKRKVTARVAYPEPVEEAPARKPRATAPKDSVVLIVFAHLVKALTPIAEFLLSDSFTAADRERARELAEGNGVSRLSQALTRLNSEAVRNALAAQQEGSTK